MRREATSNLNLDPLGISQEVPDVPLLSLDPILPHSPRVSVKSNLSSKREDSQRKNSSSRIALTDLSLDVLPLSRAATHASNLEDQLPVRSEVQLPLREEVNLTLDIPLAKDVVRDIEHHSDDCKQYTVPLAGSVIKIVAIDHL